MMKILYAPVLILALCSCDGANDNPGGQTPPAGVGTEPAPQACTEQAKICKDGSVAAITPGTCEQVCPGE